MKVKEARKLLGKTQLTDQEIQNLIDKADTLVGIYIPIAKKIYKKGVDPVEYFKETSYN